VLLTALTEFLVPQKYLVVADTGWSKWDLKITRGLCSRSLVTVCSENHGGSKRLLRARCAIRLSPFALFILRSYAALAALALILGWPLVGAVIGSAGMVNLGVMGCRLVGFGRLMHRIIEAVAKQVRLIPLEPVARAPLKIQMRTRDRVNGAITIEESSRGAATPGPPLAPG
jgi:hypothetical protein